ncbi:MAG: tetratricopeptide repeat protein [Pseudomonadota bacterium]
MAAPRPDDSVARTLLQLAVIESERGNAAGALPLLLRARDAAPDQPAVRFHLGLAFKKLNRLEEAVESFQRAAAAHPGAPEIHNYLGWTLHLLGRLDDAAAAYDKSLALAPRAWRTLMNLGATRCDQGRADEALALYARAEAIAPGEIDIALNRGNALAELSRHTEALAEYEKVARAQPRDAEVRMNIANALRDMQRHAEALPHYDQALALAPDSADVHFNRSLCLLAMGAYTEGWAEHEWRWKARKLGQVEQVFAQPKWLGDGPLAGKTLLLHAEQGLGDTLHMCRYARVAAARGARVVLQAQKPIVPLLRQTLGDAAEIVAQGEPLPRFDAHCPTMSAPLAFGTTLDTVPAEVPYLRVPPERIAHWRRLLRPGFHVGLAWSGNPSYAADRKRSVELRSLLEALPMGPRYWCLQKDVPARDQQAFDAAGIGRFEENGFPDTAAQMGAMDLVISVDTSIAHLAGAVGARLWLLLAHAADFRWLSGRTDSPWYPTARLWRQPSPGDWASVLRQLRDALNELSDGHV